MLLKAELRLPFPHRQRYVLQFVKDISFNITDFTTYLQMTAWATFLVNFGQSGHHSVVICLEILAIQTSGSCCASVRGTACWLSSAEWPLQAFSKLFASVFLYWWMPCLEVIAKLKAGFSKCIGKCPSNAHKRAWNCSAVCMTYSL